MVAIPMATGPTNALQIINNLTIVNGFPLFGISVLFFIWIIIYIRNKDRSVRHAIAGASFFTAIIGIIFGFLGLVPDNIVGIIIGLSILSFIPIINR